jgi:hypothetical protein
VASQIKSVDRVQTSTIARAPINSSIAFEVFGEAFFALAFFTPLLAFDDLKKAITVNANVSISVRIYR